MTAPSPEARARCKVRRLLRGVNASNAAKILGSDRYWTPDFVHQYLDRCELERFDDPSTAWALVREVPRLINLMLQLDRPRPDFDAMAGTIRGLGLVGEIAAQVGNWKVSEDAFRQANHWMRQGRVREISAAELLCRHGSALLHQGKRSEAVDRLESSLRLHRGLEPPDETRLAETLLLLGSAKEDGKALTEVLVRVPPRRGLERYLFENALYRLLDRRRLHRLSAPQISVMAAWTETASKRWLRRPKPGCRHRPMLIWLEGLLMERVWLYALGQHRLESAWQIFTRQGEVEQMVACGLDLAILSLSQGESEAARAVLVESRDRVRRLTGDRGLKECLAQLEQADLPCLESYRDSLYRSLDGPRWSFPTEARPGTPRAELDPSSNQL